MYLGWKIRGRVSPEIRWIGEGRDLTDGNNAEICSEIDLGIVMFDGAKLNDIPDEVGTDSEQLTAQQRRAASACGELSFPFALSQQSIILLSIFPVCKGIPASTPPARAKTRKKVVSQFFIAKVTIFTNQRCCQSI